MSQTAQPASRGIRKERSGIVVSDKMQKTIVVRVERTFRHLEYKKVIKRSKKYYAHDEKETAKKGDKVLIMESRPKSHLKRWQLIKVLEGSKAQ